LRFATTCFGALDAVHDKENGMNTRSVLMVAAMMLVLPRAGAAQLIRGGAGANPADIQSIVDTFRNDLGALNPNTPGSFATGRREINWDGVPDAFAAPNFMPGDFFNQNVAGRARGINFATPGLGLQASANSSNPTGTEVRFGHINPTYKDIFRTFTPERLFSPVGSNIVDMTFFVPGSTTPAAVRGFGAVYTDLDAVAGDTSFEYFDIGGNSLGRFAAPTFNNGLSFLGVSYPNAIVGRVRIVYGTASLGPDDGPGNDVAVMDDFIYAEPQAIPESSTLALLVLGGLLTARSRFRSGRRSARSDA
jgi:hypothetical protein